MRVFPISNWTEQDVWRYVERERLELPSLYFAHERQVFERDGLLLAVSPYVSTSAPIETTTVRFRTVGDMTCTAAIRSSASDVSSVLEELAATRTSERGATRVDDTFSEAAMEDRKRIGYF
jgi:sulfate adenylyltransferase subunit 2